MDAFHGKCYWVYVTKASDTADSCVEACQKDSVYINVQTKAWLLSHLSSKGIQHCLILTLFLCIVLTFNRQKDCLQCLADTQMISDHIILPRVANANMP